jgi:hypothetical protein
MERHRRPQPHVQKLLGPTEIPRYEKWHTREPLGIPRQTIKYSPDSSYSEQSERFVYQNTWRTIGGHLGVRKTLIKVLQK